MSNPYLSSPPVVPTITDMGGASFIDDPEMPPIPTQQPTSGNFNDATAAAAHAAMIAPFAIVTVTQSSGTYSIVGVTCPNTAINAGTVTLNKSGTGIIEVHFPANSLPVHSAAAPYPEAISIDYSGPSTLALVRARKRTYGTQVLITDGSGTYIDSGFQLKIWCFGI